MPVSFFGLSNIVRGELPVTRGVLPSMAVLLIQPQTDLDLSPGDLTFNDGTREITFTDCLPLVHSMRKVNMNGGWLWALQLLDHRWKWLSGSIGGEYNRRLPDGSVDPDTKKTPAELADLCLTALGESGFDTSHMPGNVFPHVLWKDTNPGLALKALCDAIACEVCGGELGEVTIWPAGTGGDLPLFATRLHQPVAMRRVSKPTRLVLKGGARIYCHKLKMVAIGLESDETAKKINDLSYKPANGWGVELPGVFGGLSSANQVLAKRSVWRMYRLTGQSGGSLAVPGSSVSVNKAEQYLPLLNQQIDTDTDLDSVKRPRPPAVTGTFWAYGDVPTDEAADTRYLGDFQLDLARGRLLFPVPVFSMSSSAVPQEPTINLLTSYHVTDAEGNVERLEVTRGLGGDGGDYVIRRPELFDGNNQGTTLNNGSTEAEHWLDLFEQKFEDDKLVDQRYAGIADVETSGIIAQATYMGSCLGDEGFQTRACRLEEMNPAGPSEAERKRRDLLRLLEEERT